MRSGVLNAGGPFDLRAVTGAADSTYAGIIRLVSEAEKTQAPFVRLADRYALWFLPLTLAVAGAAWVLGGPARAVAILVVATPCPLILAAPVALVSGLSAAAHRGVVVKNGGVLERLAQCTTLLLDKTGTLTAGQPAVTAIVSAGSRRPGRSCAWPRAWTRCRGTSWPTPSSGPQRSGNASSCCPGTSRRSQARESREQLTATT